MGARMATTARAFWWRKFCAKKSATASEGGTLERSPSVAILPRTARSWKSSAIARRKNELGVLGGSCEVD